MPAIPFISMRELLDRYSVLLLDAYGVLMEHKQPMAGAPELIDYLNRSGKEYFILTNDASRLSSALAAKYRDKGLNIKESRILSSGMLIEEYFQLHGLHGARCMVIGTPDSGKMVQQAGGLLQPLNHIQETDAVVLCDGEHDEMLSSLHIILNSITRTVLAGREPALILANPDIIYPCAPGEIGLAIGSAALLIENALRVQLPEHHLAFTHLGKPETALFKKALSLSSAKDAVMIGDTFDTDILGAARAGIHSALALFSETAKATAVDRQIGPQPIYLLNSLQL
jgi:HAD superfamily hydrolase (TIGR01450 family)